MANEEGRRAARAAVLAELRRRGVTHRQFGIAAKIAPGTANDFLNGTRWPISSTLTKVENYLGWPPGHIDQIERGLVSPDAPLPKVGPEEGVLLDMDPAALEGLSDYERDEALTVAKSALLERAREIRRARADG